jgi:hypothetical protein
LKIETAADVIGRQLESASESARTALETLAGIDRTQLTAMQTAAEQFRSQYSNLLGTTDHSGLLGTKDYSDLFGVKQYSSLLGVRGTDWFRALTGTTRESAERWGRMFGGIDTTISRQLVVSLGVTGISDPLHSSLAAFSGLKATGVRGLTTRTGTPGAPPRNGWDSAR